MQNTLVSVVVATYKRNNSFDNALLSLCQQTYKNIEVIVVDDNADKHWNEIVNRIVTKYNDRLKIKLVINSNNLGSAESRNKGIALSSGDYITFLDDDDIYLPLKIERQLAAMEEADADYSITNLNIYNSDDKLIDVRKHSYLNDSNSDLLKLHLMYHLTGTDTFMFKKSYLNSIGGFNGPDNGDEYYLMLDAIMHHGKFVFSDECHVKAYIHNNDYSSLSTGASKIKGEKNLYSFKKNYFKALSFKEKQYVRMRHFAVYAYTYLRGKHYYRFLCYALTSFINSPISFLAMIVSHKIAGG